MYPTQPPPIDPAELRPSRRWYAAAVAITVLCVVGGAGGCAYGLFTGIGKVNRSFTGGETVSVRLAPALPPPYQQPW